METMNIRRHRRGDESGCNYSLRDKKLDLKAVHVPVLAQDGTDRFEDDGGAVPPIVELTEQEKYRTDVRIHPPRKQRAAKAYIPKETIKVVHMGKPVVREKAIAIFEGKSPDEVKLAELEGRVRELMMEARRPNPVPVPGAPRPDLDELIAAFNARHAR